MMNIMCGKEKSRSVAPVLTVLVCAAIVALLSVCGCSSNDAGAAAAQVGDSVVYEEQVNNYTEQFRAQNELEDDAAWTAYLEKQNLTAASWREQTARSIAERMLVESRAAELGLKVDDAAVSDRLAGLKKKAGVAADDDKAWEKHLAESGKTTVQALDECRYDTLKDQLIKKELGYTGELVDELCDEYVKENLAGKTVRKYEAASFGFDKKEKAQDYLDDMKRLELDGEDFEDRLAEVAAELTGVKIDKFDMESLGWDFVYDEAVIDPKGKLRKAELDAGESYKKILVGTDACRIVRCTAKEVFSDKAKFERIDSESLKKYIRKQVQKNAWSEKCTAYLQELMSKANVQVTEMPSGLPYDVK